MNMRLIAVLAAAAALGLNAADDKVELKDQRDKVSYGIGVNFGTSWKQQEIDVDPDLVVRGIKDALAGKALMNESEVRTTLSAFQQELRAKQMEKRKLLGEKNKAEGEKFLAENKGKSGVTALPSGLQYKVLADGKGESPRSNDMVTVNYRGTLIDGTEFDSSYKRGQPATFGVTGVIRGWTEALQLMKPGAKWELFIPSELAYGERGSGQQIPPNTTLIFEVELVSIQPPAKPAAAPEPVTSDIIKVPSKEELEKGAKIEIIKKEDLEKLQKEQQQKQPEKK
jgi:FKBP-type peptidyl-prolyl cis-trans isomerase FklB